MKAAPERAAAPTPGPGARDGVVVDRHWLDAHLLDPRVRVIEVDVSPAAYDDWHIDGAVLWNIYSDLKDAAYRTLGTAALQRLVTRSGISADSTVVFYGYAPAVGLWLMKLYGHADVRILDCSRDSWRAEGHPWSTAASEPPVGSFRLGDEDPRIRADQAAIHHAIGQPGTTLVDVRSGGRVPGGVLLAVRRDGTWRPRRTPAISHPPAHRRPVRRRRIIPLRRGTARCVLTDRS